MSRHTTPHIYPIDAHKDILYWSFTVIPNTRCIEVGCNYIANLAYFAKHANANCVGYIWNFERKNSQF